VITYICRSFTFIQGLIPTNQKEIERYYSITINLTPFQFRGGEEKEEETGLEVETMRSIEEIHTGTRGEQ
jgi:hypothetical protein